MLNREKFVILLEKYTSASILPEERTELFTCITSGAYDDLVLQHIENSLKVTNIEGVDLSPHRSADILHKILFSEKQNSKLMSKTSGKIKIIRWTIAAAVMGAIAFSSYFINNTKNAESVSDVSFATGMLERNNTSGHPLKVEMEEGSVITLQPGSSIHYPAHFLPGKREVFLTGEAFFKVSKNASRPFYVYNKNIVTHVLGTSFNIKMNLETNQVEVSVRSGRVEVYENKSAGKTASGKKDNGVILLPNQKVIYDRETRQFVPSLVDMPLPIVEDSGSNQAAVESFVFEETPLNLVNAFKTDADGLPMLNTFNDVNVTNDEDVAGDDYTYSTYQGTLDPRLDWTVGRRGVPYLDWASPSYFGANATGYSSYPSSDPNFGWINDRTFGGLYSPVKNNYRASQVGLYSDNYAQGYLLGSAVNYSIIRFADVLLWAAECEVEIGTVDKARTLVNYVRDRAMTGRQVEVAYDYIGNYLPSANYNIGLYNTPWTDQATARDAVRFERRLELALEGQRFFDLVRWGIAADYINEYLSAEKSRLPNDLTGVSFTKGKNEYFPIPQSEIDLNKNLKQNPGY